MAQTIDLSRFLLLPQDELALGHEPQIDPARDLHDATVRMLEAVRPTHILRRQTRIALAVAGALIRIAETGDLPPALSRQIPPLLRDLHVAIACDMPAHAAVIRLQELTDAIGTAIPDGKEATIHALMQAQEGLTALFSAVLMGSGYDAPAEPNAALSRVASLMLLTTLQSTQRHADPAIAATLRGIGGNLLTLAALMGQARIATPIQAALHGLIDRTSDIVRGRVRPSHARAALGEGMALLLRALNTHGGDPLGCKNALLSLWGDLNTLADRATAQAA